jgi:hypothetical protein
MSPYVFEQRAESPAGFIFEPEKSMIPKSMLSPAGAYRTFFHKSKY